MFRRKIYYRLLSWKQDSNGHTALLIEGAAKIYSEKECKLDDGYGCGILGVIYEQGQGVIQDITLAKLYYKKSCDLYRTLN